MQNYAGDVRLPPQQTTPIGGTISGAQNALQGVQQPFSGITAGMLPQALQTESNLYTNPYAMGLQGAAGAAAGMGQTAAQNQFNLGGSLIPGAQAIMQAGFDPQQTLYARTLQQVQDQQRAGAAASGVGSSPYGAGLENQALSNFNIDWQNQQLGREATAAQAALPLAQGATAMQAQAPMQYLQSSALPYSSYQQIGQDQNAAIASLLQQTGQMQGQQQVPYMDYLSLLSGQNAANQTANQQANLALQQSQMGWNQMGSLFGGAASLAGGLMGGPVGAWGGRQMSNLFNPSSVGGLY